MARTRTALHWKIRAMEIFHNAPEPKPGRKRIADQLARDFEPDDTGPPKERAVGYFIKEYKKLTEDDKREYEYFAWPGSMESGLLPWEASRPLLDLLRHQRRILIPFARWYWRASQAMPDASINERQEVAGALAVRTLTSWSRSEKEALQAYLSYAPWPPNDEAKKDYEKAVEARRIESWDGALRGVSPENLGDAVSLKLGRSLSPGSRRKVEEIIGGLSQEEKEENDGK